MKIPEVHDSYRLSRVGGALVIAFARRIEVLQQLSDLHSGAARPENIPWFIPLFGDSLGNREEFDRRLMILIEQLIDETKELLLWIGSGVINDSFEARCENLAQAMTEGRGIAYPFVQKIMNALGSRKGAPADYELSIRAYEMHVGGKTHREVTAALCDCSKRKGHNANCIAAMKQRILRVRKLLAKYST